MGPRHLLTAALALLLLAMAWAASARTVLELDTGAQPVPLGDWGDAWIDAGGQATVDQVAQGRDVQWQPTREGAIYPLSAGQALWIRFTVPPAPDWERWYLEIPYPAVNRVTLYTPDSIGQWLPEAAGDEVPVAQWPVPHRHPLLPVLASAENLRYYLLKVENPHPFGAPLQFVSEGHLHGQQQKSSLLLGMFFGLALLATLIAALNAFWLRDAAYARYVVCVVALSLTQATLTGVAGLLLWPNWAWWNDVSAIAFPALTVGAFLWFFAAVISLRERSLAMHRAVCGTALLSVPVAAAILVVAPSLRIPVMTPYVVLASVFGFVAIGWAVRRGDRNAQWLLATCLPLPVLGAIPLLRALGLVPVSFWSMYGMQLGIAVQLPLLLLLLMLRSRPRREHQRRMLRLDRVDPATGLITDEVFLERLDRLVARSQRLKFRSALLLVDIVNVAQLRRDFGARAAEEMPLRVAGRLLAAARDIDSVARLGEYRFGILIEGPVTAQEAASAGPRVVARCLMPFENKPLEWVAQVRVAQAFIPPQGCDPQALLQRLAALLASVPPEEKRAVFALKD
jgi:two-component system, sensor histidine kinase LadS